MGETYGLSENEWYNQYQKIGMGIFSGKNIKDSEIIHILGRYCIGFEMITPTLKKSGWTLERFIEAEKEYGVDIENLHLLTGTYLAIGEIAYSELSPSEIREYINANYEPKTLSAKGKKLLENL